MENKSTQSTLPPCTLHKDAGICSLHRICRYCCEVFSNCQSNEVFSCTPCSTSVDSGFTPLILPESLRENKHPHEYPTRLSGNAPENVVWCTKTRTFISEK